MLKESVPQESKGKHPVRGSQAGGRVAGWEGASRGQVMFCLSIWMLNTCHSHSGKGEFNEENASIGLADR